MAFSLLEYVRFFPNFLLLGVGSGASPVVASSGTSATTDSGACSDSTTPFFLFLVQMPYLEA